MYFSGNITHTGLVFNPLSEFKYQCIWAYENKDTKGNPTKEHLHYVIEADMSESSIRQYITKYFTIPKGGKGKSQLYSLKQIDADEFFNATDYTCKYGNILHHTYDEEFIQESIKRGAAKYLKTPPLVVWEGIDESASKDILIEKISGEQSGSSVAAKRETQTEFEKLHIAFIEYDLVNPWQKQYAERPYTMVWLKQFIKSYYLSKGRPIPRSGDTNRYAYSIYAISNNKTSMDDMDEHDRHAANNNIQF